MKRILIVDDEAPLRLLFKITLEKKGYAVDAAPSGDAALPLIAANPYDLVVSDMSMPGAVDGLGVVQAAAARKIPAILCTAYSSEDAKARAVAMGATLMLEKPVTPNALAEAVGKLLT